jgi:nicotinate-nucleotide--dimethylbenzimidazole phosphoribosyltransferase
MSVVMAGDHGVLAEGVTEFPKEVTLSILKTMAEGKASINALCATVPAKVLLVDMGIASSLESPHRQKVLNRSVAKGTKNLAKGLAMSLDQARESVANGISVAMEVASEMDVFGIGEMGIGNTTPSTAIACAISGKVAEEMTGRGTGLSDEKFAHKIKVIQQALDLHQPLGDDGLVLLSQLGGFEIGGMAGFIMGCAAEKKPVIIDGLISTAAAVIATLICPDVKHYLIASHCGAEPAHQHLLNHLDLDPLLNMGYRLGEGSGAASAMPLLDQARALLCDVASLEEALAF